MQYNASIAMKARYKFPLSLYELMMKKLPDLVKGRGTTVQKSIRAPPCFEDKIYRFATLTSLNVRC